MDLTKEYPRSAHDKLAGVVMAARTADKARAELAGTTGEYNYDCPMDNGLFSFLGVDGASFLDAVKNAKDDAGIEAYLRPIVEKKTPAEVDAFNTEFVSHKPEPNSEGEGYFLNLRNSVAPDRTDVTTWADLLDLDEKRNVPRRVAA
jgi:uncharacterized protein DUF5069